MNKHVKTNAETIRYDGSTHNQINGSNGKAIRLRKHKTDLNFLPQKLPKQFINFPPAHNTITPDILKSSKQRFLFSHNAATEDKFESKPQDKLTEFTDGNHVMMYLQVLLNLVQLFGIMFNSALGETL